MDQFLMTSLMSCIFIVRVTFFCVKFHNINCLITYNNTSHFYKNAIFDKIDKVFRGNEQCNYPSLFFYQYKYKRY